MDKYKITFDSWDKVASQYQEKFMDMDLYDDTYDMFCELIKKQGARVLEIGCGPGNITRYILAKRPDLKIEGIDNSPNMITLAKENNPTAGFTVMDCRDIDKLNKGFDAIICGFCTPYLSKDDCAKLVTDCAGLLNSGGIIYLSSIEGDYNRSGLVTSSDGKHNMYMYYHEEVFFQQQLVKNDFEPVELQRRDFSKAAEAYSVHMIFIARKK